MKILVCFRPLPCWERVLDDDWESFSPDTDISYAGTAFNCFEEAALEHALRMKQQALSRGRQVLCTAATVGEKPSPPLTESLYAAGFDEVAVLWEKDADFYPQKVSARLSDFAKEGGFDIILMGKDSGMAGTGSVPFLLADRLSYPLLSDVQELSLEEDGVSAILQDSEGLWHRCVGLPMAASVGNSPAVLRAVSLRARLQAKSRKPRLMEGEGSAPRPKPSLSRPGSGRSCAFLGENPPEILARELLTRHFAIGTGAKHAQSSGTPALPEGVRAVRYEEAARAEAVFADWNARRPELTVLPDTEWGRRLAARLINREGCAFLTGAAIAGFTPGGVFAEKKVCSGNLVLRERLSFPALVTLVGELPDSVDIISLGKEKSPAADGLLWEKRLEAPMPNGLSNPEMVIVCGAGMESRESCDKARLLAERLGAGFGLSRPAALNGWGRTEEIVGQSGKLVSPRVCLVLGASGAGAFAAGIEGSGRVIAVNTDKNALIFRHADLGIIEDAPAFVDSLLKEI